MVYIYHLLKKWGKNLYIYFYQKTYFNWQVKNLITVWNVFQKAVIGKITKLSLQSIYERC